MKSLNAEVLFDIAPDIVEIYNKLDLKEFAEKNKDKEQKEIGLALIMYILSNTKKFKDEFFNVLSVLQDITVEEAKQLSLPQLIEVLKETGNNKELIDFFGSIMK